MILNELVNEVPLCEVAQKFNCSRGVLQSLQQAAATFAGQHRDACLVLRHNAPCVHCLLFCRHGDGVLSSSGLAQSGAASDAVSVAINVRSSATTCRSCASVARQWTASARAVQRRIPNRGKSGASWHQERRNTPENCNTISKVFLAALCVQLWAPKIYYFTVFKSRF